MKKYRTIILSVFLFGVFALLYFQTFKSLFQTWMNNEDYGHGFLIVPVSLYLLWLKRDNLRDCDMSPSRYGLVFILMWAALYFLGIVGQISTFTTLSMLLLLYGTVLYVAGSEVARIISFPVFFLIFMMPVPSELYTRFTNPLKLMVTSASVNVLTFFGIPVLQEGNIMRMPGYSMMVVVACSGVRSLISVVALGLLMGYFFCKSNLKRFALFIFSIPIAIFGNIMRIIITGLLAFYVSTAAAEGFAHSLAGILTFLVSMVLLGIVIFLLRWNEQTAD